MGKRLALLYIFLLTVTLTLSGCVGGKKTESLVLNITKQGEGETVPGVGQHKYSKKAVETLQATPAPNWLFSHWEGGVAEPEQSQTTVYMDKSKSIKAVFIPQELPLGQAVAVPSDGLLRFENGSSLDFSQGAVSAESRVQVDGLEETVWPPELRPLGPVLQVSFSPKGTDQVPLGVLLNLPVPVGYDPESMGVFRRQGESWEYQPAALEDGLLSVGLIPDSIYGVFQAEQAAAPQAKPAGGDLTPGTEIVLETATPGAEVYISTGGDRWPEDFVPYSAPLVMPQGTLSFYAAAAKHNMIPSKPAHFAYGEALDLPHLQSITPVKDIRVEYGTTEAEALRALASTTTLTDSNGKKHTVELHWSIPGYDGHTPGRYGATGSFDLPAGLVQAEPPFDLVVTAQITVDEAPGAQIDPAQSSFHKHPDRQEDLVLTITWNGATSIVQVISSSDLQESVDYLVDGDRLIIPKEYLAGQEPGVLELKVEFDRGAEVQLAITIQEPAEMRGLAQIGPYVLGSIVTLEELDQDLQKTGQKVEVKTLSPQGEFGAEPDFTSDYVEITVSGKYFNPVQGMIDGPFTIRGIAQVGDGSWGNINLLTTLARDRILRLVEQGLPVQIAKEQAEREVLALVHIPEEVMGSFSANDLDISAGGPADAMLLALTLIVLGEANPYQLELFVSDLSQELRDYGSILHSELADRIRENAMHLDLASIRQALEERYAFVGMPVTLPPFEDYVDRWELLEPQGTIGDTRPEFSWSGSVFAQATYELQVATDPWFEDILYDIVGIPESHYKLDQGRLANHGEYYWRVLVEDPRGSNYCWAASLPFAVDIGRVEPLAPQGPIHDTKPVMEWSDAGLPGAVYHLQLAEDTAFHTIIDENEACRSASYRTETTLANLTSYAFRVAIIDQNGVRGDWSDPAVFSVDLGTVEITEPVGSTSNSRPAIRWSASPLPNCRYQVQIAADPDFNTLLDQGEVDGVSFVPTVALEDQNTFYCRIAVIDQHGVRSLWSDAHSFQVDLGRVEPLTSLSQHSRPTLAWTPSPLVDVRYHVQIALDDQFAAVIDQADDLISTHYQTSTLFQNLQVFYYRVAVSDQHGVKGSWSAPQEVVVDLGTVQPLTSLSQDSKPLLSWSASNLPGVSYHLQLAADQDFQQIIDEAAGLAVTEYRTEQVLPNLEPHYFRVAVIDENGIMGSWSEVQSLLVDIGTVSPWFLDQSNSRPEFVWEASNLPHVTYHFQLARDGNFNSIIEERDGLTVPEYQVETALLDSETYFFRVAVIDQHGVQGAWNGDFIYIVLGHVEPLAPRGQIRDTRPWIEWTQAELPGARYRVLIAGDLMFEDIAYRSDPLSALTHRPEIALDNLTTYYLRVAIIDQNDIESTFFYTESFWINLGTVTPKTEVIFQNYLDLTWTPSSLPGVSYHVQIALDADFLDIVEEEPACAVPSYQVQSLWDDQTYYYRVAVVDENGVAGVWSPAQEFTYRTESTRYLQAVPGLEDFAMRLAPAGAFPTGIRDDGSAMVDSDFWIAETEVTYGLWYEIRLWAEQNGYVFANLGMEGSVTGGGTAGQYENIGQPPTISKSEPVTMVSWLDAVIWCNALSERLGYQPVYLYHGEVLKDASDPSRAFWIDLSETEGFRLPTEEEWELAARYKGIDRSYRAIEYPNGSGVYWTPGDFASGATAYEFDPEANMAVAWYSMNSGGKTQEVAQLMPNALGLYDLSGNVQELCFRYREEYQRVRGGSWRDMNSRIRIGRTLWSYDIGADTVRDDTGFRLVRTAY